MKRFLCILLVLSFLLPAMGCRSEKIDTPVSFYYLRKSYAFGDADSILAAEIKDASQYPSTSAMLGAYLRGPGELTLEPPFPAGTYLLDLKEENGCLFITLSDNFASHTGIALSLACCALAKTAMEFSGAETVQIRAVTALLDGESSITVTADAIVLHDSYEVSPTGGTE